MIKNSLKSRKQKANLATRFVGVLSKDKNNRPKTLEVPGSEGKRYHVILRRYRSKSGFGVISAECRLFLGIGFSDCKGNSSRNNKIAETICYHSRAAIDFTITHKWDDSKEKWVDSGLKSFWAQNLEDAQRLQNLHKGNIFVAKSHQNSAIAFILVTKEVK